MAKIAPTKKHSRTNRPPKPRSNRLREIRESRKLTQSEVAKVLDLDVTTVCKHETGARGLTAPEIRKYSSLFKVQSIELFFEPDETTNAG